MNVGEQRDRVGRLTQLAQGIQLRNREPRAISATPIDIVRRGIIEFRQTLELLTAACAQLDAEPVPAPASDDQMARARLLDEQIARVEGELWSLISQIRELQRATPTYLS